MCPPDVAPSPELPVHIKEKLTANNFLITVQCETTSVSTLKLIINREAMEIIRFVGPVCPSTCLSVHPSVHSLKEALPI